MTAVETSSRPARLLYRELRDTLAAELPAGDGELRCLRDYVDTGNRACVAWYAAYVARFRSAVGLAEGCGHCASKQWRLIHFRASSDATTLWFGVFVACTTCGHCERV